MKRKLIALLLLVFAYSISSFEMHKFYMAIYQVNYVAEKKMLQITTRIFFDDLDKALEKKYNKKSFLLSDKIPTESLEMLKKYLSDKFTLQINGQTKPMNFLSVEMEGDVLVCYLNIKEVSKIKSLEINNSILTECYPEQQNILHLTGIGDNKSFLFTASSTKEVLKY